MGINATISVVAHNGLCSEFIRNLGRVDIAKTSGDIMRENVEFNIPTDTDTWQPS